LLAVGIRRARRRWRVGTRVRLVTRIRRPRNFGDPGEYDMVASLARRGIHASAFLWDDEAIERRGTAPEGLATWLDRRRAAVERKIARVAAPDVRAYLDAVLLGADGGLDRGLRQVFARTGLAHVVSVSGFHVAVVAMAATTLVRMVLGRVEGMALTGVAI